MSHMLLAHRRSPLHSLRYRDPVPLKLRVGKFFLMSSMVILGGLMSFLYLMHYTEIQTKGYQLKRLEMEREQLKVQQEIKTMNVAKVRALMRIQESPRLARMVPMRNPIYLSGDTHIASK